MFVRREEYRFSRNEYVLLYFFFGCVFWFLFEFYMSLEVNFLGTIYFIVIKLK